MSVNHQVNLKIAVPHVTRIEGHGNIHVHVRDGEMIECRFDVIEAPRFFEAMLRGRPYSQASHVASRICGICAATHATTSLRAVENALGIEPSAQTQLLRKLNLCGEMIDSHILHIYMLVVPDLLGLPSVLPLADSAPEIIQRVLKMKRVAGDLCAAIGGRHTHPISMVPGGFTRIPSEQVMRDLETRLHDMNPDLEATLDLIEDLTWPSFQRESEYISLHSSNAYPLIDGLILSSDGGPRPLKDYREVTNEYIVGHSSAKHARNLQPSYMVGALARYNLNFDQLVSPARKAAERLGLPHPCHNPYLISLAQTVELVHFQQQALTLMRELLDTGLSPENPEKPPKLSGEGIGACEAPRGTLFHHYTIEQGVLEEANCVIPTAQNLANLELDMRAYVQEYWRKDPDQLQLELEMLVRAYDPCISCSTHCVDLQIENSNH